MGTKKSKLIDCILIFVLIYGLVYFVQILFEFNSITLKNLFSIIYILIIYVLSPLYYFYKRKKGIILNSILCTIILISLVMSLITFRLTIRNVVSIGASFTFLLYFLNNVYRKNKGKELMTPLFYLTLLLFVLDYGFDVLEILKINETFNLIQMILSTLILINRILIVVYFKNDNY